MKLYTRSLVVIALVSLFIILFSCKKPKDEPKDNTPGTNEVFIQNTAFNPSTITVSKGTTITWSNKDDFQHTVTSLAGIFDSGKLNQTQTFSLKFDSIGTFPYACQLHSGMKATVVVQ